MASPTSQQRWYWEKTDKDQIKSIKHLIKARLRIRSYKPYILARLPLHLQQRCTLPCNPIELTNFWVWHVSPALWPRVLQSWNWADMFAPLGDCFIQVVTNINETILISSTPNFYGLSSKKEKQFAKINFLPF